MLSDAFPAIGFGRNCGCFIAPAGWLFLHAIQALLASLGEELLRLGRASEAADAFRKAL